MYFLVTIYDNNNYGNRLQNYATYAFFKKNGLKLTTIKEDYYSIRYKIKTAIKIIINYNNYRVYYKRRKKFMEFSNIIPSKKYSKKMINDENSFIIGSDQVWNPYYDTTTLLHFLPFECKKKISFASSFGVSNINTDPLKDNYKLLNNFNYISVREDSGQKIIKKLTGRTDVEVLIDPTMLLTAEEWDKVSKKPAMLKTDKYILNYFLGNLSEERRNEINRVAQENNCEVINILDKESPFYECGPSEFLYLEKNAFLICTDSFHSSVFGILYNTPFLVFEREDNTVSMNSRLDTLLSKFKLEDRRYKGKITKKALKCDYTEAYRILDKERIKSMNFLKTALDIKDSDKSE